MLKVENIEVYGWEAAIRGMRNPMNSWEKSDSTFAPDCDKCELDCESVHFLHRVTGNRCFGVGENDLDLMKRLYNGGTEHRKYLRMITATMDITAPLYWWKEFDTYKVGTVANSCSTMHKIHAKEFTFDDFSTDHLEDFSWNRLDDLIGHLNICRNRYIETKEKQWWWQMIQLLPSSYNQRRTVQMSYENVMAMIKQRANHKLDEWVEFVGVLKNLPYVREITGKGEQE